MIDVENKIFKIVYDAVMQYDDSIHLSSSVESVPAAFPSVFVVERGNSAPERFRTSSRIETYAEINTEVTISSNKAEGRKAEIKPIFSVIDDALRAAGLRRTSDRYFYPADSITQRTALYECLADADGNLYAAR